MNFKPYEKTLMIPAEEAPLDANLAIEFMERLNLKMKELEYTETTGIIPIGGRINV